MTSRNKIDILTYWQRYKLQLCFIFSFHKFLAIKTPPLPSLPLIVSTRTLQSMGLCIGHFSIQSLLWSSRQSTEKQKSWPTSSTTKLLVITVEAQWLHYQTILKSIKWISNLFDNVAMACWCHYPIRWENILSDFQIEVFICCNILLASTNSWIPTNH